jgi:riboflavin synthase
MFSGIIEEFATVVAIKRDRENLDFTLTCSFVDELSIDQSVAHNGVCLTVVSKTPPTLPCSGEETCFPLRQGESKGVYTVTAMKETLDRSNLGLLKVGDKVNVERSMLMNGRLDGHIVQGHVDMTARCTAMEDADGSTYFTFSYDFDAEKAKRGYFTVDKGSVTVNGVSLTVCNPTQDSFQVAIIPYTFEHTNFQDIRVGSVVNLEFDILGKYIARLTQLLS